MSFKDRLISRYGEEFDAADFTRSLLYVIGADGVSYVPVDEALLGGSVGAGDPNSARETTLQTLVDHISQLTTAIANSGKVLQVYPPQVAQVGVSPATLNAPLGANAATVFVISGSIRSSVGGVPSATTPLLNVNDSEALGGAELAAYRMVREGGIDATVYVNYARVG